MTTSVEVEGPQLPECFLVLSKSGEEIHQQLGKAVFEVDPWAIGDPLMDAIEWAKLYGGESVIRGSDRKVLWRRYHMTRENRKR